MGCQISDIRKLVSTARLKYLFYQSYTRVITEIEGRAAEVYFLSNIFQTNTYIIKYKIHH